MMTADGDFRPELFRRDGVHLNRGGQMLWGERIKTALESVVKA
jgi:lysophospholipase L1-like esterase